MSIGSIFSATPAATAASTTSTSSSSSSSSTAFADLFAALGNSSTTGGASSAGSGASCTYDSVSVTLPSGLSIGMAHFGTGDDNGAADAQMLQSVEQMAEQFAASMPSMGGGSTDSTGATSSQGGQQSSDANSALMSGFTSFDMIEIDMPNGTSIKVEHATSTTESADQLQTVANQMAQTAEQLFAALEGSAGSSAGTDASAGSTGATGSTSSTTSTAATSTGSTAGDTALASYFNAQIAAYAASLAMTGSSVSGSSAQLSS